MYVYPMLTAECFSTEYHNSRWNIIILFWKYLDIRSEVWLIENRLQWGSKKYIPAVLLDDLVEGTRGSTGGSSGGYKCFKILGKPNVNGNTL